MSSETTTRFTCDGPGCDAVVVSDLPFDLGPDTWFRLEVPDGEYEDEARHFHSAYCLYQWASFAQLELDQGL